MIKKTVTKKIEKRGRLVHFPPLASEAIQGSDRLVGIACSLLGALLLVLFDPLQKIDLSYVIQKWTWSVISTHHITHEIQSRLAIMKKKMNGKGVITFFWSTMFLAFFRR